MNPELTQKLYEKYPAIFAHRCGFAHGDGWYDIIDAMCQAMTESYITLIEIDEERAKAWGIEPCKAKTGEVPKYLMEVKFPQVVAHQVKEKLGHLRFYYSLEYDSRFNELLYGDHPLPEAQRIEDRASEFIHGIVWMAETLSTRTCEETGKPGELHVSGGKISGWLRTLNREFAQTDAFCKSRNYVPLDDLPETEDHT